MTPNDHVYVSLEVMNDEDESTYDNRVHGGELVEVQVNQQEDFKYVHIQLIGKPNFEVYPKSG